ncbi:pyridoxamine 5'-phosphate oxidase family protein [Paenibacillus algorifonticola]|uniref:pyridoxamine 5'-phosphate oxidase family protein n=1 Tax=Paenibacillus algorifonticola TaxID=684063 RepID=UPI003D2BA9A4
MGKAFEKLLPEHEEFIGRQHMFFVGSAPLTAEGHVNISPKGYDTFRILSSQEVAYLDLTGSGNETSAHVLENGRMTIMFVAMEGKPVIMRLFGTGNVVLPGTERWSELIGRFELLPGARQIIVLDIHKVTTACGFSIPFYDYQGEREQLKDWAENTGDQKLVAYQNEKNSYSLDRLPTPLGIQRQTVES